MPCVLGSALALLMLGRGGLFTEHVQPVHAMLFLSAAMAITAFPVLARIITERGISGTAVGSLALAAGAVDDAAAWIILAVVLSSFTGNAMLAFLAAGGGILYVVVVFGGVRPLLRNMAATAERHDGVTPPILAIILDPRRLRRVVHRRWSASIPFSARSSSGSACRAAC